MIATVAPLLALSGSRALLALAPPRVDDVEATFREFIRTNVARADAAPATVELYLREARAFRQYLADRELPLRDVRSREIREWVRWLTEVGRTPGTIATKLVAVRRMFAAAVDAGMLPANPAEGVQGPKDRRETGAAAQRTLDVDEVKTLLSAAPGDRDVAVRDRALLALLVGHGLRTVEVERLNVADVDLAGRTLLAKEKTRDRTVFLRGDVADQAAGVARAARRGRAGRSGVRVMRPQRVRRQGAATQSAGHPIYRRPRLRDGWAARARDGLAGPTASVRPRRFEAQRPRARSEGADGARASGD